MASVTSTQVISDMEQADGRRYVRYRFDLLDNLNQNHVQYIGPKLVEQGFNTDADMVILAGKLLEQKAEQEKQQLFADCSKGNDPFHYDAGGYFVKNTLAWGDWNAHWVYVAKMFWSQQDKLAIVPFADCWGRVSSGDKRDLLGIDNQQVTAMNGDMQDAINVKTQLDGYTPYFEVPA